MDSEELRAEGCGAPAAVGLGEPSKKLIHEQAPEYLLRELKF